MSLFSTGLSGLNAAQVALQTAGTNVSNVYTPGYNRQVAQLGETLPAGGGVQVNDVERQFNQYIASQLNAATSRSSALETYSTQASQIDNLLADSDSGLAPLMQSFFSSMQDLAGAPSDPAARQGVIGTADTLTGQFRAFDSYLDDMQSGINGQIRDEVTQINNTADQLAKLNRQISLTKAKTGDIPNNLLNQRDHMVATLSERLDVSLSVQDGDTYNVMLGNGQPLVAGNRSYTLEAVPSSADPSRTVVAYNDPGGSQVELRDSTFEGGTLGGLMTFRRETLDKTQNQLGQMALSLAAGFNDQHRAGQDLNGDQGGDFFAIGGPTVFSDDTNQGNASITSAVFSDVSQVTSGDYELRYDGSSSKFSITRLDTGAKLDSGDVAWDSSSGKLSFDGVTLTLDDPSQLQNGDVYQLQPTRNLAGTLENVIHDTSKIAASAHVAANISTSTGSGSSLSVDSVTVGQGFKLPPDGAPLNLQVNTVNSDGSFELGNAAGGKLGAEVLLNGEAVSDPTAVTLGAGDKLTVDGVALTFSGTPVSGDTVQIKQDPAAGDNTNALALQNLQNADLVGGKASLNESYASMVSDVGNRTNVVKANLDAQNTLTEQLTQVQQSESGVNLDEEAANLIRFQQYYQANAKVIQTASTVFDSILGIR
ncbi:flagellar hook-associated protein FlgK [Modicisalibacter tunisiensis]|uniref:Flagellar hook-associated protein 1 n=1 Tax=Modicisalibacter tunisiensis TaxID=390637 RepID=A0ABS7X064_9GAMM|nr:flagellar hook-associated protein FlgK [Modicisalibacter tunisiensis]MBZ9568270.1 flagellar hook-associated protein FlgK [Modicisalibacter tunisiensis]